MKTLHSWFSARIFAVFAALVICCAGDRATTLLRMSLARMSHASKAIVRARCVESSAKWERGEIWTFTSFETEEIWRGSPPAHFTVRLLGGRSGNLTANVAGVPRFAAGEDVILFLEPAARGDFTIVGWEEGTFRIGRDRRAGEETVTEDSAHLATFNASIRQFESGGVQGEPLRLFRARVAALLRSGGGQ
jgi:hypothetical protein